MKRERNKRTGKREQLARTVAMLNESTPFAVKEAYKAARTNLMFMFAEQKYRCVSITSSFPGEGKTTTCANLAIAFAQTGVKTLIIDGDLRKPRMHRMFSVHSTPGVSDVLGGFAKKDDAIMKTRYENLYLMPAGTIPPNPAELLSSHSMDEMLRSLIDENGFEYIFVDTPPINVVTDAAVVSHNLAGTVVVVKSGSTGKESLKGAILALEQAGVNVLGFILNNINIERYSYKYSYKKGSYKQGYHYGYYEDKPESSEQKTVNDSHD